MMTKGRFNRILKERIHENALKYLTGKQRKKGNNITYIKSEMAEYLLPDDNISITQKRRLFAIRSNVTHILL